MNATVLDAAQRVLETGEGLREDEVLQVLQLPDEDIPALLELAHRFACAGAGPRSRSRASSR